MKKQIEKLIDVKSIVTIAMTAMMAALLLGKFSPSSEIQTLFATSYGAVITYFFTKRQADDGDVGQNETAKQLADK